jgi:hypothetical protein
MNDKTIVIRMTTQNLIDAICDNLDCNSKETPTSLRFGDFNEDGDFSVCGVYHHPVKNKWFCRIFEASYPANHTTRDEALAFLAKHCGIGDVEASEKENHAG